MASPCWGQAHSVPKPIHCPFPGDVLPPETGHEWKSALHSYKAQIFNQPSSSSLEQTLKKVFGPSIPSPGESEASPCSSYRLHEDCPFASPVVDIHPHSPLAVSIQPVKHSYTCPVYKPSFLAIPFCLMFPAARHSLVLAAQLVSRTVAHTAVPRNTVASYPKGRLVQGSFPFE